MRLSELQEVALSQKAQVEALDTGLPRLALAQLPSLTTHALIVAGIRRCGKSTLLHQFVKSLKREFFFLNFDDLRLFGFDQDGFSLLDAILQESSTRLLFFDEIQSAPNWELYVRQKLDQGYQVIATGSNASLLGGELGTKLTGRHITKELFTFSFAEYLEFRSLPRDLAALTGYLAEGGFPEFLKTGNWDILNQLQTDILYRDIAVRYAIRDVASLKRLFVFLLAHSGQLVSPSKLLQTAGVKSASTILEYFSFFEAAYLIQLVPKFSWSPKAQSLAPKKLYVLDTGLIRVGSPSFSPDRGSLLETFVFLEFRRVTTDIFYFADALGECDFVIHAHDKPLAVQVCWQLTLDNQEREIRGLLAAMTFFNLTEGWILTADTTDKIVQGDKTIQVVPAHGFDFQARDRL